MGAQINSQHRDERPDMLVNEAGNQEDVEEANDIHGGSPLCAVRRRRLLIKLMNIISILFIVIGSECSVRCGQDI